MAHVRATLHLVAALGGAELREIIMGLFRFCIVVMGADGWAWHSAYSTPTQCAYGLKRFAGSPRLVADLGNAIARGVAVEHRDVNGTRWLALADTSPRYVEIAAVAL